MQASTADNPHQKRLSIYYSKFPLPLPLSLLLLSMLLLMLDPRPPSRRPLSVCACVSASALSKVSMRRRGRRRRGRMHCCSSTLCVLPGQARSRLRGPRASRPAYPRESTPTLHYITLHRHGRGRVGGRVSEGEGERVGDKKEMDDWAALRTRSLSLALSLSFSLSLSLTLSLSHSLTLYI